MKIFSDDKTVIGNDTLDGRDHCFLAEVKIWIGRKAALQEGRGDGEDQHISFRDDMLEIVVHIDEFGRELHTAQIAWIVVVHANMIHLLF